MKKYNYWKIRKIVSVVMMLSLVTACVERDINPDDPGSNENLETIRVPEEFEFTTAGLVEINIQDANVNDIIHEFRYPLEQKPINEAYNFFINWAASGGSSYQDWYKDNAGYRNTNKIYQ